MEEDRQRIVAFLLLCMAVCSYAQQSKLFFRKDYNYLSDTESFYKIHTLGRNFDDSLKTCEMEGASLFFPENDVEAKAVIGFWNATQKPIQFIRIGITSFWAEGVFETIDGRPISDVYNNWAPGEPNNVPPGEQCVELTSQGTLNDIQCGTNRAFICKKTLATLQWNQACNMPNLDYKFEPSTGQCYKFNLEPKTWNEAYATCVAEQSYLAVVNSQQESNVLVRITAEAPKESVAGNYLRGAVHLGFRKIANTWVTIKGQRLQESGFCKWGPGQPDNAGGAEVCGSMFYSGPLNDINCSERMFFICEHDVPKPLPQT